MKMLLKTIDKHLKKFYPIIVTVGKEVDNVMALYIIVIIILIVLRLSVFLSSKSHMRDEHNRILSLYTMA